MEWGTLGKIWFFDFLLNWVVCYYVKAVGDRKILSKKTDYFLLIIAAFFSTCTWERDAISWTDMVSTLLFFIVLFRPFKQFFYKKMYLLLDTFGCVVWMYCILMAGYGWFVDFQYMNLFDTEIYLKGMVVVALLLFVGLFLLVFRKKTEISFMASDRILLGIFISLLFAGTAIVNGEVWESIGNKGIVPYAKVCNAMFVFMGIMFPLVVIYGRMSSELERKQNYSEQYIALELEHFQREYERQKEIRRFGHDMKNHLLHMNQLLEAKKTAEAEVYCKELLGNIPKRENVIITGDDVVDGILSYKAQQMKEYGIRFEITGLFEKPIPMKPVDICTIFANALDNAMEACERMREEKEPWITMQIKRTDYFCLIELINSSSEKEYQKKDKGKTSKTDKENHGFGLENIRKTMEKYGGTMEIMQEADRFRLRLILKSE
ncbi:MAG: sensor histidine kinase [Lachnospiraceae bacterium]|nr:sensor histidine kinase [Lachnospiraceae bacterium]